MQVNAANYLLVSTVVTAWFIYFQYYWFPQLQPKHFSFYCCGLAVIYAGLNWGAFLHHAGWVAVLAIVGLLVLEVGLLSRQQRQYLPAFLSVTILAYLLTQFVDMLIISAIAWLTRVSFATSFQGGVTEVVCDSLILAVLAISLWTTRAPMENLIQGILGHRVAYFFLGCMILLGASFVLLANSVRLVAHSSSEVFFLSGIAGVLMTGLALTIYLLMQMHLQQEHARAQEFQEKFQAQYSTELERQMAQVRQFRHDYQNMMMGLSGYLYDHDYAGFRQLYIDIRSNWTTNNAADLTIEDLDNVPKIGVRYTLYHHYLAARDAGIPFFVNVPAPVTTTLETLRQLGRVLDRTIPQTFPLVQQAASPEVVVTLTTTPRAVSYQLVFPVTPDVRLVGHKLVGNHQVIDFSAVTKGVTVPATLELTLKGQWVQLRVVFLRE